MPTYEYECLKCRHRIEKFQSMTDVPLKKCPDCGGKLRRLIGRGSGIIFKGAGFYATDYRKPNKKTVPSKKDETSGSADSKQD